MSDSRILTGYRPTGKLHIGHWFGNLLNMKKLQEEYDCFFFVADLHALTSEWSDPSCIREHTREMVLDWVAAGIDPEKCAIYRQSDIPEVSELMLYFSMVTPMSWLERVPTYKEQKENITDKDLSNVGFFLYPELMACDILIMESNYVPVGEDQLPHLELTRELVRRFNFTYGKHELATDGSGEEVIEQILIEPDAVINEQGARVPGSDGRKMSKSYGNAIYISDKPDVMRKKIMGFMTDPARKLKTDPGEPNICPLHQLHKLIGKSDELKTWEDDCRCANCGCVAHKKAVAQELIDYFEDFSKRRSELENIEGYAEKILEDGAHKAKPYAIQTIDKVRKAVCID